MEKRDLPGGKLLMCASRGSHLRQFHGPYVEWLAQHGWQVDTISQGKPELSGTRREWELEFSKRQFSIKNIQTIFLIRNLLRREKYDVVVAHATLAGLLTKLAAVLAGRPRFRLVLVCHGYLFREGGGWKSRVYRWCEKAFSGRVDCLVTMNGEDTALAEKYQLCRKVVQVPGMGLCPFPLPLENEVLQAKKALRIENCGPVFLCVGEFSRRKNQAMLLNAFQRVHRECPGAKLLFAGEGALLEECRRQAVPLGDFVQFLGQRRDIPVLLACCDWLVTASRSEGLPFSVMEALYLGKPVLASAIKGHRELVQDGKNGRLFPLESPSALESQWVQLAKKSHWQEKGTLPEKYMIWKVFPQVMACYLADTLWEKGGQWDEAIHMDFTNTAAGSAGGLYHGESPGGNGAGVSRGAGDDCPR